MKTFRQVLLATSIITSSAMLSGVAQAQTPSVEALIGKLQTEGFVIEEVERTWLGRYKIEARKDGVEREIVINGSSGEILRDRLDDDDRDGDDDNDRDEDDDRDNEDSNDDRDRDDDNDRDDDDSDRDEDDDRDNEDSNDDRDSDDDNDRDDD